VKPEVFDSILANLSFLSGNHISCLPQKGEKKVSFFHTSLLSWSSQQKVVYILEECAARLLSEKAFRSDAKAVPKIVGVFEDLWQPSPSQLSLFSSTRIVPLEVKDG
jgi:hypothetical protein